jgi:DNA-binding response OmpR family regulator
MSVEIQKRILIVEDEPAISALCKRVMIAEGYEVDVVSDGKAAGEAIVNNEYRVILLDIRLPVESGIDLYIWLQQEYPDIAKTVIFMTGSVLGGDSVVFLERSGRPYILKPFRPNDLKEKIRECQLI